MALKAAMAAVASAAAGGFLAASILAAMGASADRPRLRRLARGIGLAAAALLLTLMGRAPARPFVAFAVVAALPSPQPVALALAAGAAVLAGLGPVSGLSSWALFIGAAAAALAAHAVGRSVSAHLAAGGDAAWPASAAGTTAGGLVVALDAGRALRWDYGFLSGNARVDLPDAGLLLGLALLASLAAALLLGADALAAVEAPSASPLARMLGRRSLLLASGLALLAAGLVVHGARGDEGALATRAVDVAALVAVVGLLAAAVPALLAERPSGDVVDDELASTVLGRLVLVVALGAVLAAGIEGWLGAGSYLTARTGRLLCAALVSAAAAEVTPLRVAAQALALVALVAAVLR